MSNAQVAATAATAPNLLQRALAKGFNVGIQKFRDFLATLRETAVKEQEVAISAIAALVVWVKERNPTMGNDNLIVGYCDHFF